MELGPIEPFDLNKPEHLDPEKFVLIPGDVWIHTLLAVNAARKLTDDLTVLFATLLHDTGKPSTTKVDDDKIRSRGHEEAGAEPTKSFLNRLHAPNELVNACVCLVENHLAPAHFVPDEVHKEKHTAAGPGAYRRLARKLDAAGTNIETLYLVSKADHLGRTTADALSGEFPSGEEFLRRSKEIKVNLKPETDIVLGRHLIARGMNPGPEFGKILTKCREIQFDQNLKDPDEILKIVLHL